MKTQTEARVNALVSLEAEPPAETSGITPAGSSRSKWVALAAGVLLSVVLPVLAFQGIDLAQSWRLVLSCSLPELLLAGGFFLVALWARAWRWRFLLAALGQARVRSCLSATCVGSWSHSLTAAHGMVAAGPGSGASSGRHSCRPTGVPGLRSGLPVVRSG